MAKSRNRDIASTFGGAVANNKLSASGVFNSATVNHYDSIGGLPLSSVDSGSLAFVVPTDKFYVFTNSGWYNITLSNNTPYFIVGPDSAYTIDSATGATISLSAGDSDFNNLDNIITYSVTLDSNFSRMATITQDSSVFTISPKSATVADSAVVAAGAGNTSTITFTASDGITSASQNSVITYTGIGQPARNFVTDSIVAFYDAQDTSSYSGSGSTWTNISGQSGDLTIYNSPTWNSNGYFTFNGSTQYMRNTNLFNMGMGETFTVEGFVFIPSSPSYFKVFSNDRVAYQGSEGWIDVEATTGKIRYGVDSRVGSPYSYFMSSGTSNINLNGWNYFSMTGNIGTTSMSGRLLINGEIENLSASLTWSGFTDQNYTQFSVGRHYNHVYSDNYFNSSISMIRLYNDQLTQAEQEQNFEDFLNFNSISFTYTS